MDTTNAEKKTKVKMAISVCFRQFYCLLLTKHYQDPKTSTVQVPHLNILISKPRFCRNIQFIIKLH